MKKQKKKTKVKYGLYLKSGHNPVMIFNSKEVAEHVLNKNPLWEIREIKE